MSVDSASEVEARTSPSRQPQKGRSRISNHHDLLPEISDGRAPAARRFRDLVRNYISDMGGIENCSAVKIDLLRRLAATTVVAELLESKVINGEPVDIAKLCTLASTTVRIATRLGLERQAREIVPDPLTYAASFESEPLP